MTKLSCMIIFFKLQPLQERELKAFRETQKQEMKLVKQETDTLKKKMSKEALRRKTEEKIAELVEKVLP